LYYLNCCCSVMPDHAATQVFQQMDGVWLKIYQHWPPA
jgi:hypothetical protein